MLRTISEHLGPVFFMAVLMVGTQAFARRVQHARLHDEASRLRSALAISLQALRILYQGNLGVLIDRGSPLISGRNQINLFRLHFGRLISLNQSEIEAVIAASIAAERVETAMAIAGKSVGGVAFAVPDGDDLRGMVESALLQACALLETAEGLMTPSGKWHDERIPQDEMALPEYRQARAIQSVHARQTDASDVATERTASAFIEQLLNPRISDSAFDCGERKCAAKLPYPGG
jgi:hypothetical protein